MMISKVQGPVAETIHDNKSKFERCIPQSITLNSGENLKVMISFVVGIDGDVVSAEVERSSAPDPDFTDCLIKKLASVDFPHPNSGKNTKVQYVFTFKQASE